MDNASDSDSEDRWFKSSRLHFVVDFRGDIILTKDHIRTYFERNLSRVIQAACVCGGLIVLAVGAHSGAKKADPLWGARESFTEASAVVNDVSVSMNDLITGYYNAYCTNDIATLENLAYPISAMEKSYIAFMSGYTDSYDVAEIYFKPGADNGSYLVSVNVDVKFKDIDVASPGLSFFYVRTDNDGNLYIDNRYGTFNMNYGEEEMDPGVSALIEEFQEQQDVIMLRHKIQNEYDTVMTGSEPLSTFINNTLPTALAGWNTTYYSQAEAERVAQEAARAAEEEAARVAAEQAAAAEAAAQAQAAAPAPEAAPAAAPIPPGGYAAGTVVVASDILNIRKEPDVASTKEGTVLRGDSVTVIENSSENGWTHIDHHGKQGYIRTDVLR